MKAPKHDQKTRILLIDSMETPHSVRAYGDILKATVACLGDDGMPRNWSRPYFSERFKDS